MVRLTSARATNRHPQDPLGDRPPDPVPGRGCGNGTDRIGGVRAGRRRTRSPRGHADPGIRRGSSTATAVFAIAILALSTGALHLDGLADTADALAASDPTTAERARRDPAVGAAGAAAVVLVLMLDAAALAVVGPRTRRPRSWSPVPCHGPFRTRRAVGSTFGPWVRGLVWRSLGQGGAAVVVLTSLAIAFFLPGAEPKFGVLAGLASGLLLLAVLVRRFGVVGGDSFGAAIKVAFAASLVAQAVAN